MNHANDANLTPEQIEEEYANDLAVILAVDWREPYPTGVEWAAMAEAGKTHNAKAMTWEQAIRCKCGTVATIGPGKGPHAARADCPICKRWWWIDKSSYIGESP